MDLRIGLHKRRFNLDRRVPLSGPLLALSAEVLEYVLEDLVVLLPDLLRLVEDTSLLLELTLLRNRLVEFDFLLVESVLIERLDAKEARKCVLVRLERAGHARAQVEVPRLLQLLQVLEGL